MMSLQKSRVYSFSIKDEEKKTQVRNGPFLFLIEEEKKNKEGEKNIYDMQTQTYRSSERERILFF